MMYGGIAYFVAVIIVVFSGTIGPIIDRATARRERIRSEAEKHMAKMLDAEFGIWKQ
jgi:hypothetical protein